MIRMRTPDGIIGEIKEIDPNSAFTKYALRQKIKNGEIPSVKAGKRYLVNLDIVLAYLSNTTSSMTQPVSTNGIRKISEK